MTTYTPDFAEAHARMSMLKDAAATLEYNTTRAVWDSITGRVAADSDLADAVMATFPEEHATIMRLAGGIPAAVFCAILGRTYRHQRVNTEGYELRSLARSAWEMFAKRVADADKIQHGTGWDLSDAWQTTVEINDDHMWARNQILKIAKLAGRMYEVLQGVRRMVPDGNPQEVKSITLGGDIERLMPSEHALLANPMTSDMKAMDVLQCKALQVEVAGEKPAGRGPLVLCIDESGSMHGQRNVWAKACAVALTRVAHEENRMVHVVHFSTGTLVRHVAPNDRKAVLEMMSCYLDGGTQIASALEAGDKQVKKLDKVGHKGADVVMITDGTDSRYSAQQRAIDSMKEKGVRLWTVGIAVHIENASPIRKDAQHFIYIDEAATTADGVAGLAKAATGERAA